VRRPSGKILLYACSVEHANVLANLLVVKGYKAATVSSRTPPDRRRKVIAEYRDAANLHANRVQVVPLSSKTGKRYPGDALISVDGRESKAMADQITTVSTERLRQFLGLLSPHDLHRVEMAIRIQLGLIA